MKMKGNTLLKVIVPTAIAIAVFIGIKTLKNNDAGNGNAAADPSAYQINNVTPDELRVLNIQGDTSADTVKTLIGETKETRRDVASVVKQNERLLKENQALRNKDDDIEGRVASALAQQREEMLAQFENEFANLASRFENKLNDFSTPTVVQPLRETQGNMSDLGLEGDSLPIGGSRAEQIRWVMPGDMQAVDRHGNPVADGQQGEGFSFANVFSTLDNSALGRAHRDFTGKEPLSTSSQEENPPIPVYTLPENSTLIGSVAMTALLGRIPLAGSVSDPYPFKVLIGRENLTANGIDLPDVEGAVLSGTATGDWTLSCVRGEVESMTFVFSDGRTRTVPEGKQRSSGSGQSGRNGIGWLSDPYGLPCIPGERKTNAGEYLAGQFLLSAGAAAAQGMAQGQTTTVVDGNSVVGAVTGDQGRFILGQAIGGGLKETTEWYRQRYGQTFDAVYVPPGHPVAVHISSSIEINYEPNGRKVKYFAPVSQHGMD